MLSLLPVFLPASQPVVLVVLHYTCDPDYIAPQSKWSVNREGVFPVDILFNEDKGLLRNPHNDMVLKSVTDYLISLGTSSNVPVGFEQLAKKTVCNFHHCLVHLSL